MKELICHTVDIEGIYFTKGKSYEITKETEDDYIIIDNTGKYHFLTKHPDYDNLSYKTWFELVV